MSDSTCVYLPKLFGGPSHGKRIAFSNPRASCQYVAQQHELDFNALYHSDFVEPVSYKSICYTRRDFAFGSKRVIAFVINTATAERAFEMVCNYLLRTAIPC